jgi:hypothetical protein
MKVPERQLADLVRRAAKQARIVAIRCGESDLDEAESVALVALAYALKRYRRERASIQTYSNLVVSCRVRDWARNEQRHRDRVKQYAECIRIRAGAAE